MNELIQRYELLHTQDDEEIVAFRLNQREYNLAMQFILTLRKDNAKLPGANK